MTVLFIAFLSLAATTALAQTSSIGFDIQRKRTETRHSEYTGIDQDQSYKISKEFYSSLSSSYIPIPYSGSEFYSALKLSIYRGGPNQNHILWIHPQYAPHTLAYFSSLSPSEISTTIQSLQLNCDGATLQHNANATTWNYLIVDYYALTLAPAAQSMYSRCKLSVLSVPITK
jgi:hypothetical protein